MSKKKSYLDEIHRKELLEQNKKQKIIESHKCYRCVWGKWTGTKYKCMFSRCQSTILK